MELLYYFLFMCYKQAHYKGLHDRSFVFYVLHINKRKTIWQRSNMFSLTVN